MLTWKRLMAGVVLALGATGATGAVRQADFDPMHVALVWHKLTGEPLDLAALAERSDAVRRASNFDRPDAVKAERARLEALLAGADPAREFTLRVSDNISQYDHDKGEFPIALFQPGYYVPLQAFGKEYQVVFANAASAQAIPMAKEPAREFDARLNAMRRNVTNEIRFRVIGKGDPTGAVTGALVVRAEILGARLLDRDGTVLFTPTVSPYTGAVAGGRAAPMAETAGSFDLAAADVAGFRIGVKLGDLDATLQRLFGKTGRAPGQSGFAGYAGILTANQMGCMSIVGKPKPRMGTVCVVAFFDKDEVVRAIKIQRLFPAVNDEAYRTALVAKYGPVADAKGGAVFLLGWGPRVDIGGGPQHAMTATFQYDNDFMGRSGNSIGWVSITLHLVDAAWASTYSK
jgi:hypothetical protein